MQELAQQERMGAQEGPMGYGQQMWQRPLSQAQWTVPSLMNYGASVNQASNDGTTLLSEAAQFNSVEVVELLLKCGANVNHARNDGTTPLYFAAQENSVEVVELLVDRC